MLVLLPPSEGKHQPTRGRPLDLEDLTSPGLTDARAEVLDALATLGRSSPPDEVASILGIGTTQLDQVARLAQLRELPTARAERIYTGVLYDALGLATLPPAARRRAASRLAVVSGLFGLLRVHDRIPAYRCPGDATLPGLGPVARHWSTHLRQVLDGAAESGLVVDLRSSAYAGFWRPPAGTAGNVVSMRVVHERDGVRKVVSHFNKATKGRLLRELLVDGSAPSTSARLAELLRDLGWRVEAGEAGAGPRLDVVVTDLEHSGTSRAAPTVSGRRPSPARGTTAAR